MNNAPTSHVRPLHEIMDPGWAAALSPVEPTIRRLGNMLREEARNGNGYLPEGSNIFRAFTYPFDAVKVLLVGQDPYPTPGHPMGLSFSVRPDLPPPKSLVNIFRELQDDLHVPAPRNGDLTPWCEQGVMLLNRVLSVRPGKPASHRNRGWEEVTTCAIDALVARNKPLVAILWGNDARTLRQRLQPTPTIQHSNIAIIESPHPSPLSAHRGFFGSRPFSRTNDLLRHMGVTPINWALPPVTAQPSTSRNQ